MTVREGYDFATMAVLKAGAKQRRLSVGAGTITGRAAYLSAVNMNFQKGGISNAQIIKTPAGRMGVLPESENRPPHLQSPLPQLRERLQAELSG